MVQTKQYAFLYQYDSVVYLMKNRCDINLVEVPTNVGGGFIGFIWKKHFPYRHLFNYYIRRIKETGHLDKIVKKYLSNIHKCGAPSEFSSINIGNVYPAFLLILMGIVVSSALQIGEMLVNLMFIKRNKKKVGTNVLEL